MSQYLSEAFKKLSVLNEDTFSITDSGLDDFIKFSEEDEIDDTIDVIDPEAETLDDLEDSYVGKVILDCCVCHSKLYKDVEDVVIDGDIANANEECPFCYTTDGFKVIGQVASFDEAEKEETEEKDDEGLDEGFFDKFKKSKKDKNKSSNSFVSATAGGLRKGDKVRIDSHLTHSSDEGDTLLILKSNPHRNTIDKTFIEYENSFGQVHNAVLPDNLKVKKLSRGNNESLEEAANFRIGMFGNREWYDNLHKTSEDVINQKIDDLQARLKKLEGRDDWTDATEKTYYSLKWEIAEYKHELEQRKKSPEQKEQDAAKEKEIQLTNDQKRTLKYYRDEIEDYERKARTCIINGNRDGAEMWQDRIKRMKKLIAELTGKNESLKEDINNLSLDTDDTHMEMTSDENGKVTISTEPITSADVGDETIQPLEPEVQNEIDSNVEDGGEIEIDMDEFDEESFDELGEGYLKKVYENVNSFKTSNVSFLKDKLILEGVIKFNSGNSKKTNFVFGIREATKSGKIRFIGENKEIARGRKSFTITGRVENKKFLSESLNYNYGVRNATGKAQRLYGTIKNNKRG